MLREGEAIAEAIELLLESGTRATAKETLLKYGPKAEPAVLTLLTKTEAQQLLACGLLEEIATAQGYQALRDLAERTNSRIVRVECSLAADAVAKRLDAKK